MWEQWYSEYMDPVSLYNVQCTFSLVFLICLPSTLQFRKLVTKSCLSGRTSHCYDHHNQPSAYLLTIYPQAISVSFSKYRQNIVIAKILKISRDIKNEVFTVNCL